MSGQTKVVKLYHQINGEPVEYRRACTFVRELDCGRLVVRIRGAADNHFRDRIVKHSQLEHLS